MKMISAKRLNISITPFTIMLLFFLVVLLTISTETFAERQSAADPWMEEMEKAKGLTVGDLTPKYGEPDAPPGDDGTGGTRGTGQAGNGTVDPGRTGPIDPNTLDPNKQDVTGAIREWISNAKPPTNALQGANLRYSKWGQVVGQAVGGVISARKPDNVTAPTPEGHVWNLRDKLDSIDHCTLEEYVVAKLGRESISQCAGRYGAVKNLKGVKLTEAKVVVTNKGFTSALAPGSPAQTPEEEDTVEKQEPGPEQYLKKGDTVKLYVHSPYVPPGSVLPDFKNEKISKAKKWLKKNDFKVSLKPGSPAPAALLSGVVEGQDPPAGTKLQAGEEVLLTVYSPFVDMREVPNLVGEKLPKAKALLQQQGFEYSIKPGSPARSVDKSGTIESQEPGQGAQVAAGTKVSITVHSNYINTAQVPDVQGLVVSKAKKRLATDGFKVKLLPGPPAPTTNDSGKVVSQQPAGGTEMVKGSAVAIKIYSPFVAQERESITEIDPVAPDCQCRVETSLMNVAGSTSCSTFKEAKNAQGTDDIHGRNVVVHIVNDRYLRGGNWSPPANWHYGRGFVKCQELLKDEQKSCARFCPEGSTVSQQRSLVAKVPNVTGQILGNAKGKLTAAGFTVKLLPGPPAPTQNDSGKVTSQKPAAGASVTRGSEVAIKIYSPYIAARREPPPVTNVINNPQPTEMVRIPYVTGKSLQKAEEALRAVGLKVSQKIIDDDPFCEKNAFTVKTVTPKNKARRGDSVELGIYGQFVPPAMFPDCPSSLAGYPLVPYYSQKCKSSMSCDYDTDRDYRNGGVHINIFWETSSPQKAGLRYCREPKRERQYDKMTIYSKKRKVGGSVRGWSLVDQNWARGLLQQWMGIAEPLAQPCGVP